MQHAKYISETSIIQASASDYLEDGITLKSPDDWLLYFPTDKPTDESIFKTYEHKYVLSNDSSCIYETYTPIYFEPEGRVAKLDGSTLIFPSKNEYIDGRLICNYNSLPNSRKMIDGWYLIEETDYPQDGKTYTETGEMKDHVNYGKVIKVIWKEVIPAPESPFNLSKKLLLDKIISLDKYEVFMQILNSDPVLREYWLVSVVLSTDDVLVKSMIPVFCQSFQMTEDQIMMMLKECKSDL